MERLSAEWDLEDKIVGLGIDRIDYTKGIPHRIRAIRPVPGAGILSTSARWCSFRRG